MVFKLEFRRESPFILKTIIFFVFVFCISLYLSKQIQIMWSVYLLFITWISPLQKSLIMVKMPYTQARNLWGKNPKNTLSHIIANVLTFFIHCTLVAILIIIGSQFLDPVEPYVYWLGGQLFMVILFTGTLTLPVSIIGDVKRLHPNWKSVIYFCVFSTFIIITLYTHNQWGQSHPFEWYMLTMIFYFLSILVSITIAIPFLKCLVQQRGKP